MKRLERFDPIAVLDKVNELVDAVNSIPVGAPNPPALAPQKSPAVRQVLVTEHVEPEPPKAPAAAGSAPTTGRIEAALNVAINRLIELKDTATVERIHRIWRRA